MAKHIYHLPLVKIQLFVKENKSIINEVMTNKYIFEYRKNFGKSYFDIELEKFIEFFKINKDYEYATKVIKHFTSETFLQNIYSLLDFNQFKKENIKDRDFLYTLIFVLSKKDQELISLFFHKIFIHFHTSINKNSNIIIDYLDLSKTIAKNRNIVLKESFGEMEDNSSYFKIFGDGILVVEERGKSIKTLRKKAYKRLCFTLLDE